MQTFQPHQERVLNERLELGGKIEKLAAFIDGPIFLDLGADEQTRLRRQHRIMVEYLNVLTERIDAWS